MKLTYVYDPETKYFQNVVEAEDGETVENSTELKPEDGLYNPKWDGSKWVGQTLDEFIESNPPDTTIESSKQDQINAQLLKSFATQQLTNATLVKQIAELQKGGN